MTVLEGLVAALTPGYLLALCVGTITGIAIGALPGLTATMGTALLVPFTFALPPGEGLAMLAAVYISAMFADAVPACLVNTPGTPSAMATALDGFPLTKMGRGHAAIAAACFSSLVGTLIGGTVFLLLMAPLALVALRFGPPEFFWIGVFAVTIIGSLAGGSLLKGIGGGLFGMLIGTVGISQTGSEIRYTFGIPELLGGVSLVAGIIGVFAIPQIITMVADRRRNTVIATYEPQRGVLLATAREVLGKPVHLARSGIVGALIGILPGAGSPVAALVSYDQARRWSRTPEKFGRGAMEGVTASETAGNSAAPGAMVPLMGLGVPGSGPAAVIGGALLLHGLRPGPELVETNGTLVYGFAWSLILAGFTTYLFGSALSRLLARMVTIPVRLLVPIIMLLTVIGAFAIRNNMVDVYLMLGLGVFCYLLTKLGFHPGPIGLGLILSPIVEPALVQSLALAQTSSVAEVFFARPVSVVLIILTCVSVIWTLWSRRRDHRRGGAAETAQATAEEVPPERAAGRWELNVDVAAGVVLLLLAGVSFTQLGTDVQSWGYPRVLTYLLFLVGAALVVQGLLRPARRLPLLAGSGGRRTDIAVFVGALVAYPLLIVPLGFWLPSFLMLLGVSLYLAGRRDRRAIGVSLAVSVLTCLAAYLLFRHVFYVPFPEAPWTYLML